MLRFLRNLLVSPRNAFHWWLDYVYVAFHQVKATLLRTDFAKYRNGDANKPEIILLPGVYETWRFMQPIADMLDREGCRLHIIEGMGYNSKNVEDAARLVAGYVHEKDLRDYVIVAHSKGGLIGKYILMHDREKRACGMVAIATPFSGSVYAKFFWVKAINVFSPNSPILQLLGKSTKVNKKIVSVHGMFDPHIPSGSHLEGATNIQLPVRGHFKLLGDARVHQAVREGIDKLVY